jgi:hypothetical protein
MMESAKKHLPGIPICLSAAGPIGPEDILVVQPDSDIGGRRAKLAAYDVTPPEWDVVLYLDADTEIVGDIRLWFELVEDGWEFVITKDPHLQDTLYAYRRRNNMAELTVLENQISTLNALQLNGGVWSFRRTPRVARFFKRWQDYWEENAGRDQGPLVRALYEEPLQMYVLGNQWNTVEKYCKGIKTAGLMHYPGRARRWEGLVPGRLDEDVAWQMVEDFANKHESLAVRDRASAAPAAGVGRDQHRPDEAP